MQKEKVCCAASAGAEPTQEQQTSSHTAASMVEPNALLSLLTGKQRKGHKNNLSIPR
jgi:hypothetical protein